MLLTSPPSTLGRITNSTVHTLCAVIQIRRTHFPRKILSLLTSSRTVFSFYESEMFSHVLSPSMRANQPVDRNARFLSTPFSGFGKRVILSQVLDVTTRLRFPTEFAKYR